MYIFKKCKIDQKPHLLENYFFQLPKSNKSFNHTALWQISEALTAL